MEVTATGPIDLHLTLMDSGQCFQWVEREGWFCAAPGGMPCRIRMEGEVLQTAEGDETFLRRYLDIDADYAALSQDDDPILQACIRRFPGLRLLDQPVWETLLMFILSANNNVARIRKLTLSLAARFGQRFSGPFGDVYALPTPAALAEAGEDALRELGAGYRAPYLVNTARRVLEGFPLDLLRDLPYPQAHARLKELPGVGDKVADCVLLFGCGHREAFPTDVWVARVLGQWYGMCGRDRRILARMARERFGKDAGLKQQFLFHAARTEGMEFPFHKN